MWLRHPKLEWLKVIREMLVVPVCAVISRLIPAVVLTPLAVLLCSLPLKAEVDVRIPPLLVETIRVQTRRDEWNM